MSYVTKDSGQRQEFSTGSRRDTQEGKPRFDLVPVIPLKRLADLYARGAAKYGDHNWQKGQPISRYYGSLLRHVYAWAAGDDDEDHLIAASWNAFSIVWTLAAIEAGGLPEELNDFVRGIPPKKPVRQPLLKRLWGKIKCLHVDHRGFGRG
jgi:hypothetical protein